MPINHTVEQGDSVIRLSDQHGLFARTFGNDLANAALKKKRKDMNVLLPGDVVVILDKRVKNVERPTGKRHLFRRKGIPAIYRIQVFDREEPRASQHDKLTVDDKLYQGTTDDNGVLEAYIPATSQAGELVIGPDEFTFLIEHLDSIDEVIGIKKRLNNLGFLSDQPDGVLGEQTRAAILAFQKCFQLDETGEVDEATRQKLEEVHDAPNDFPEQQTEQ